MPARYAVFGHPIGHSKSPLIHAAFARQTGQDMRYEAILAPLDGFADALRAFRDAGGQGANVTVPFKEQAFQLCTRRSARADLAGAVNTLTFTDGALLGDNTDGAGLVNDLTDNLGLGLAGLRILLLGAGGAARGVIGPLLERSPASLFIANRTAEKAVELAGHFRQPLPSPTLPTSGEGEDQNAVLLPHASGGGREGEVFGAGFDALPGRQFDLVINATAASLAGELPPLPDELFAPGALAYDMMYGRDTPFLAFAHAHGAHCADGLGMLVEQAAEAFLIWRGIRPDTAPVIAQLRAS